MSTCRRAPACWSTSSTRPPVSRSWSPRGPGWTCRASTSLPIRGIGLSRTTAGRARIRWPRRLPSSSSVQSPGGSGPALSRRQQSCWTSPALCHLVGGLPLAILLAASWTGMLTPAEIAAELEGESGRGLDLLQTDGQDLPARQRSMRAVFDHSWDLLADRERQVLAGLSVFRGSFTLEAARQVAGASLRALRALMDRSLLQRAAAGRYAMHELLRQYASGEARGSARCRPSCPRPAQRLFRGRCGAMVGGLAGTQAPGGAGRDGCGERQPARGLGLGGGARAGRATGPGHGGTVLLLQVAGTVRGGGDPLPAGSRRA